MKKISVLFVCALFFLSCGGRTPSPRTAHKVITKHFQKYGKKYKDSDFGTHRIEKVEIIEIHELQKDLAEAYAYAHLSDGLIYRVRVTLQKRPFGWKYLAWENLGAP